MSRIVYPKKLHQHITLLSDLIARYTIEPEVLTVLLNHHNINLNADKTALDDALTHQDNRDRLQRKKESARENRDLGFKPVFTKVRGLAAYLKTLSAPNYYALGEWGVDVIASGKIKYPVGIVKRMDLFDSIKQKHDSYPAGDSPLQPYMLQHEIDMAQLAAAVADARTAHQQFLAFGREVESETEKRNQLQKPVVQHLRTIGLFLKSLHAEDPAALGLWGFDVVESPAKPKFRTSKLKLGHQITTKGVVLGSTLENLGETVLHLTGGKRKQSTPVVLQPGEKFKITKGFSIVTILNTDSLRTGIFRLQKHH